MTDAPKELASQFAAAAAAVQPYPEGRFDGRGIVICAGGARLFTCAYVAIGVLRRHLGCTLPTEVWHLGPEEMGPAMRGLLDEFGVETVDAHVVAKRHHVERLGGWELKSYALMHSRFREVLLLDADNVPVKDPSFLFERPEFRDAGALFWPDLVRLARTCPIWAISGLAYRDQPSFESGQIVLDKARCWNALSLANWMNQRSDAFYDVLYGDKDTFLIAWLKLGQPHFLIPHLPKRVPWTMCQRDPDGAVLFQHRSEKKWILHGDNPPAEGFRFEAECLALLKELATKWDGRIFNPPSRSDAARALERAIAAARHYRYTVVSSDERAIELWPDHRVGVGAGAGAQYWFVGDGDAGPELILEGEGRRHGALTLSSDGIWRGSSLVERALQIELAPVRPVRLGADDSSDVITAELLDRALDAYSGLPWDESVAHDFAGTIRTFALLDPAVATKLRNRIERPVAHARLIEAALDALGDHAPREQGRPIATGNGWHRRQFDTLKTRYERLR